MKFSIHKVCHLLFEGFMGLGEWIPHHVFSAILSKGENF